jgi:hypothetical protein
MNSVTITVMRAIVSTISFAVILLLVSFVQADTLAIPGMSNQPDASTIERPVRGLNKTDVREKFGEPPETRGPVGNPPITRWIYPEFTVVFESNIVIHTFAKK